MILVAGTVNLDHLVYVTSLPKPGETVLATFHAARPGGKGANQALAAARMGSRVRLLGAVGEDDSATAALRNLVEAGVDLSHVARLRDHSTGFAYITVDDTGENTIVVATGANHMTEHSGTDRHWDTVDLFVAQLELGAPAATSLAREAKRRRIRSILNVSPLGPIGRDDLQPFDYLVLNVIEAESIAARLGLAADDPDGTAHQLAQFAEAEVVITKGSRGASLYADGRRHDVLPPAVEAVDTVGAGDTFLGAFAALIDRGRSSEEALRSAVAAASLSVQQTGAQEGMPFASEVEALLASAEAY